MNVGRHKFREDENDIIRRLWPDYSSPQIAKYVDLCESTIRHRGRKMGLPSKRKAAPLYHRRPTLRVTTDMKYPLCAELGIEPVVYRMADRNALSGGEPIMIEITLARVRFLEGPAP